MSHVIVYCTVTVQYLLYRSVTVQRLLYCSVTLQHNSQRDSHPRCHTCTPLLPETSNATEHNCIGLRRKLSIFVLTITCHNYESYYRSRSRLDEIDGASITIITITNQNYDDLHFASCVLEKSGVHWIRDRKQSRCKSWCWLWEPKYLNFHHNISFSPRTDNVPCQASVNTLSCQLSNNSRSKHHQCSDALGKQAKRLKHNWQLGISIFGPKKNLAYLLSILFLINSK